jgi:hypothetical protein
MNGIYQTLRSPLLLTPVKTASFWSILKGATNPNGARNTKLSIAEVGTARRIVSNTHSTSLVFWKKTMVLRTKEQQQMFSLEK